MLWWLLRVSALAEQRIPTLPAGPVEFFLQFDGFENWHTQQTDALSGVDDQLEIGVYENTATVLIRIPVNFIRNFANPKNIAERKLIGAFFTGLAILSECPLTATDVEGLTQEVVRNDEARFFHITHAREYRQHVDGYEGIRPRFVQEGDINFAALGVSWRVRSRDAGDKIVGLQECNIFLHAIVDDCWANLRGMLALINRASIIGRCLENVEAIESDRDRWRMTAAALLAAHNDREDVIRAARERETMRVQSSIGSRILVEMALCASPANGGEEISLATLDTLLAEVNLLLYAANRSDALKYELTKPEIALSRNGEFSMDSSYQKEIIAPYVSGSFTEQFELAAAQYGDYYQDPQHREENASDPSFPPVFVSAFREEYGITPEDLMQATIAVEEDGIKEQKLVLRKGKGEFYALLKEAGLCSEVTDRILTHFALWPRVAWDATPDGFTEKDWYPWRFRRRLSLVARPFVVLGKTDDAQILYAPGMVADNVELHVVRYLTGELPPGFPHAKLCR